MAPEVSVVCPFYDEEAIIERAVERMLRNLAALQQAWELIIVDDGSRDRSLVLAHSLASRHPHLRVISNTEHRGRGYALRTGAAHARGRLVVTTEIDSSWGDNIVSRIIEVFRDRPDTDMVIASPHLRGGGYRNVPRLRVLLSTIGNFVIRTGLTYDVTMNTGMTRGYVRERLLALPLREDDKELHLEIVNKALAFGYRIEEIPAVLEWPEERLRRADKPAGGSSQKLQGLIQTHLLFSFSVAPFRFLYPAALLLMVAGCGLILWSAVQAIGGFTPTTFLVTGSSVALFGLLVFGIGILAQQNRSLMRELWYLERDLQKRGQQGSPGGGDNATRTDDEMRL